MANLADFYGIEFETDYSLFGDQFEEIPAVYVVYTTKKCLDIGESDNLKAIIEEHPNTRNWILAAEKDDIFIAFCFDDSKESREDKVIYLKAKMHPLYCSNATHSKV